MVDPVTAGTIATGLLALDPVKRLLGPTADVLGAELAAYTQRRLKRAEKIIEIAAERVTDDPSTDKSVSSRVLLAVLDEGSKSESEIAEKYYGGVLAASRSPGGSNDDAITYTSLLSSLPSAEIHLHYVLYSLLRHKWKGCDLNVGAGDGRQKLRTIISYTALINLMGGDLPVKVGPRLFNLARHDLIETMFTYGKRMQTSDGDTAYFLEFHPTVMGCGLYLAAIGRSAFDMSEIFSSDYSFAPIIDVPEWGVFKPEEVKFLD